MIRRLLQALGLVKEPGQPPKPDPLVYAGGRYVGESWLDAMERVPELRRLDSSCLSPDELAACCELADSRPGMTLIQFHVFSSLGLPSVFIFRRDG